MSDSITRALTALREHYPHDPLLDSRESFLHVVHEVVECRDRLAGEYWTTLMEAAELSAGPAEAVRLATIARQRADTEVLDDYITRTMRARAVHDSRYVALYAQAAAQSPVPDYITDPGPDKRWLKRAEDSGYGTELLGLPGDYCSSELVEDVAIPPAVPWSAADEVAAIESAISTYGIEPGQWFEVEWPPEAHLWSPGYGYQTEWEPCEQHFDDDNAEQTQGCPDCDASVTVQIESPAEWKFTTELRIYGLAFDSAGNETEREVMDEPGFEVRTLAQDPRYIVLGGPGRDILW